MVRQTAAVARVFNGFALATVLGLPIGTLVGQRLGWHAAFVLVTGLAAIGLLGILVSCPSIPRAEEAQTQGAPAVLLRPSVLLGLLTTLLTLSGFVAAFTYVAPMLREMTGLTDVQISVALLVYGVGTFVGNVLSGRVQPHQIAPVLPAPLLVLTALCCCREC